MQMSFNRSMSVLIGGKLAADGFQGVNRALVGALQVQPRGLDGEVAAGQSAVDIGLCTDGFGTILKT